MSVKIIKTVKCPTCAKPAVWDKEKNPARPFCCDRCRLIDLGAWADESHRIADATPPDFDPDGSSNH